jgi:prepilin-type N-terminal cleavage/methylation domain-containing protein
MLKHQRKPENMQRSPQSPGDWGVNKSQGRSPQPPLVRGAQESQERLPQSSELRGAQESGERSPQPPLVRGAQESHEIGDKSHWQGLTNSRKESKRGLNQLQLLQLRLSNKNQPSKNSSQSGFTLMECLLAIMIVAILLSAVAPAIVLAVATRLQARRVELASQAAQAYIDGVRSGRIRSDLIVPVLIDEVYTDPLTQKRTFTPNRAAFAAVAPPTANELTASNCIVGTPLYPYCNSPTSSLYCVDLDGGGCTNSSPRDLIVQAFRLRSSAQQTQEDQAAASSDPNALNKVINKNGFLLGVRVYRADSFKASTTFTTTAIKGKKDSTFTGGTGLKINGQQPPLAEQTTEISARGSSSGEAKDTTSYAEMCARLGGCDASPSPTP